MTEAEFDTPLDFSAPMQGRLPGAGHGRRGGARRNRTRWSISCTTVAASSPTKAAASARPAAKERIGRCRCSSGSRPAADGCKDLDLLLEIGDSIGIIPGTTICGLADGAAWPIKNAIRKFRGEFEDYIKRTNPGGCLLTDPLPAAELLAQRN